MTPFERPPNQCLDDAHLKKKKVNNVFPFSSRCRFECGFKIDAFLTTKMQAKAHTKDTMNAQKMTQKLLDQTRILELENALKNAPPPPRKLTQKETLAELAPTLRAALSRGHTFESLVAVFGAEGTKISARALAQAMRVPMPKGNTTANGKKIKAAAGTAALIEPIG